MKIIDIKQKGNVVRFYLGEKTDDWGWTNKDYKDYRGKTPDWLKPEDKFYGDDWDDPIDDAGEVYGEFIKGYVDKVFDFNDAVVSPRTDYDYENRLTMDDLVARRAPILVVIPKEVMKEQKLEDWQVDRTLYASAIEGSIKYYIGDELDV